MGEQVKKIEIGDIVSGLKIYEIINKYFGKDYEGWGKAWFDINDEYAAWFPTISTHSSSAPRGTYGGTVNCLNTLSEDMKTIIETNNDPVGKSSGNQKYDKKRLVFARINREFVFLGVFLRNNESTDKLEIYRHSRIAVGVNLDDYSLIFESSSENEEDSSMKNVLSFAAGSTYGLIRETLIHAHPVKRGFPGIEKVPEYIMFREHGGISHELYRIERMMEFNPYDEEELKKYSDCEFYGRLEEYITKRANSKFGFKWAPLAYRYYILKSVYTFEPFYSLGSTPQGYLMLSFDDLKIRKSDLVKNDYEYIEKIYSSNLGDTEKSILAKARIGQGEFRSELIRRDHRCLICGLKNEKLLFASHIKPWKDCDTDFERLDSNNGLLLCSIHDDLFDKKLISFDEDGRINISSELSQEDRDILNLDETLILKLSENMKKYMSWHRAHMVK